MSAPETTSFKDLALAAPVQKAIDNVGYEQPSPIQAASIPHLLNGDDLLGVAQTGTGKTAAFALPLLSKIDIKLKTPQTLVLAPTRELAIQVAEAFQTYASQMKGFHVLPIYGGQDMSGQLRQLKRGVHVVVGTPGRIMDHLRRGSLKLEGLTSLVLDEADEMLRMGFIDDVEWILEHTPKERQVALFSATMPKPIRKVADRYLNNPKEVSIARESTTAAKIEQNYLIVNGFERKLDAITRILEADSFDAMIIFVRTKTATAELAEKLEARGYSASALNGDMNQALRERTINRLKKKQLDIIVATDVAARGIDVERVSHVLNFDIPYDPEAYVHRIGRTGRAGREGKAILFVAPREKRLLQAIEKSTRQPIAKMELPSGVEVSSKRIEQFKQQLTEALENQKLDFFHQVLSEYSIEADRSAEDIACALAYLLQKDKPLEVKDEPKRKNQRDSFDKPERNDNRKSARKREEGKRNKTDINMVRYRIEVGRDDGVTPGNIVGAIANETGIDGDHIGHIKLHDNHSTVDLPEGMPKDMLNTLKKVRICNKTIFMAEESTADKGSKAKPPKKKKGASNAGGKVKDKVGKGKKTDSTAKVKKRKAKKPAK
ncbi:MAG: DEAD/DEAH box helicase [Oceanicoccus sp.]|uniref:DEAD/DEAH box helicase n=1 Tax=Oceanicoccus sp. TaxID=2691044 RepID=UPI002616CD4A|nr:DEAD/DEAH box helicase [Oceanicoccus sp.]MCP3907613.1 DEAD/DEAH box helicase [Oceanicoccus sp.]MDG1773601.1 DEAD/DEAH box helicase [Oceanicoccus sp.]